MCHIFPPGQADLINQLSPYLRSQGAWDVFLSNVTLVGAAGEAIALPLSFVPFVEACGVPVLLEAVSMQPSEALPCLSIAIYVVSGV